MKKFTSAGSRNQKVSKSQDSEHKNSKSSIKIGLRRPHSPCGSAIFYSFHSAHRLRIGEQNNLRADLEPQIFPAPVTKYNITNTKIREIIPDPHPVQDPVAAAQFLHMHVYSIFGQFCPEFKTDGFTDKDAFIAAKYGRQLTVKLVYTAESKIVRSNTSVCSGSVEIKGTLLQLRNEPF
jgi:hypothetical protein